MPENVPAVPNNPPPPRVEEARMATTAVASSPSVDETREDSALPQKRTPDAIKRATIGNVAGKYDDPIEEDDSSDEDLDVAKAPSPPPAKKAKTSVPPSNGETSGLERADKDVVHSSCAADRQRRVLRRQRRGQTERRRPSLVSLHSQRVICFR